jgi:outer membrane protein OmpA-like peptidoglycan-associated protein
LIAAAALVALPVVAQAQSLQYPGFYVGLEGGVNWMLNTTILNQAVSANTGFAAGGVVGYDFVGPRVEIEGVYRNNTNNTGFPGLAISNQVNQLAVLANLLYDFSPGSVITPYIGVGAGIAFVDGNQSLGSTQFAYQGIVGLGWNVTDQFRVNLDGRYYGTTNPQVSSNFPNQGGSSGWTNNNFSVMLGLQIKFGAPAVVVPPPPPPPQSAPSYMVFFDWDRSNLSDQALATIGQAANAYKTKGNARITATGHTDTSGPEAYNMALSLRRANTVKDALVRNGVPATAIAVIGRGEQGLLVQTADGVREPQNRRVEIVIQ